MNLRSDFLRRLQERGYIHQCTDLDGLDEIAESGTLTAYVGFDCTAPSLHIGNLLSIMMLRRLQQSGHRPIVLLGGATTRIGDPSGKEESRKLLDEQRIEENIQRIKNCFEHFLRFDDSPTGALLLNNRDWLDKLVYIDFLREYGRHFSVNRMLGFDSIKQRLEREQPLSFLEFNYMVFQAYDFLELARRHDCALQMGGSDQWGNIVNGVELARKTDKKSLFGLTTALITTANGQKMGKTADGALWLDATMTDPWEYWQYWRDVDDGDVGRFLRLFTELPLEKIAELEALQGQDINKAKIVLADEVTAMLHGEKVLPEIHAAVKTIFEPTSIRLKESFGNESDKESEAIPSVEISPKELEKGYGLLTALVKAELAASNSEARRHIREGAVRVNEEVIKDEKYHLAPTDMTQNETIQLRLGKKHYALLRVVKK